MRPRCGASPRGSRLYQASRRPSSPTARTGLDMFRDTLARGRDARPRALLRPSRSPPVQLDEMSDALAVALQQRGAEPASASRCTCRTSRRCFVAVLAAWKCGAVIVPCNPMLRERELVKILSRLRQPRPDLPGRPLRRRGARGAARRPPSSTRSPPRPLDFLDPAAPAPRVLAGMRALRTASVAGSARAGRARTPGQAPEPVEITGDDVAFMVYTSGTTGEPKAAMNTHRNVVFATSVYERWIGLTADGHDPRPGAAVSRDRPHRPRHAGDADRQPAGAVLPLRRRRGVPAGRARIAPRSPCRRSRPSSPCSTARRWARTTCRR